MKIIEKIKNRIPSFKKRMMNISFDISAQIYEYMKNENDMSQKELAVKMNKKESEVSKWLSGGHNFTIETIAKIEEVFKSKILIVPLFAFEDLGIKDSNSKSVTIHKSLTKISADDSLQQLIMNNPDPILKYADQNQLYNSSSKIN